MIIFQENSARFSANTGFSSRNSFMKATFVESMITSCPVNRFSHLSCGSLLCLQGYHRPPGCHSDWCHQFHFSCNVLVGLQMCHSQSISGEWIEQNFVRCPRFGILLYNLNLLKTVGYLWRQYVSLEFILGHQSKVDKYLCTQQFSDFFLFVKNVKTFYNFPPTSQLCATMVLYHL